MAEAMRIALIDDDVAVLDSLRLYFERNGVAASCFTSADAFLAQKEAIPRFDCIVADVRMPGKSGLDLVRESAAKGINTPTILITGHGDIDMAVAAIKLGAFDFVEKPFDEIRLLHSIQNAVEVNRRQEDEASEISALRARFQTLTQRQREVMRLAVTGLSNKEIAAQLGISPRTVEIHRAWMMERMNARNLAHLVRMQMQLDQRT
jgi:two-component system response regulator FixJ